MTSANCIYLIIKGLISTGLQHMNSGGHSLVHNNLEGSTSYVRAWFWHWFASQVKVILKLLKLVIVYVT